MFEYSPRQNSNEGPETLITEGLKLIVPESIKMRSEVYEIATQLEASEETYQKELKAFLGGDVIAKKSAWVYLEDMHSKLVKSKNLFDISLGYLKSDEDDVRSLVEARRAELSRVIGSEVEQ